MGEVPHLLDFNQALAGRILLMSGRNMDSGPTASRNSLDVSNGETETLKSTAIQRDQTLLNFEGCKSSKKSSGMPIKTLIAQELSKEPESRNRTPNLVARLMGLDALPVEQKNGMKEVKLSVAEPTKSWQHEKRSQETKSPQIVSQKNAASQMSRAYKESVSLKSYQKLDSDWEAQDAKLHLDAMKFLSHPQEQQKNQLKRELVAQQSHMSQPRISQSQLEEVSAAQQSYACEKLNEAKLANAFEEHSGPVYSGSEDTLFESKELSDAVAFLQSNKDLLLKFIQEPNSLFAHHLQDPQSYLKGLSQATSLMKQKKGCKLPKLDQDGPKKKGSRIGLHQKDFLDPLSYKSECKSLRQSSPDLVSGKSTIEDSLVKLLNSEFSPMLFQKQERQFATIGTDYKSQNVDSQAPTRIVVLKPSPRRTKSHKYVHSFSSSHFPTGFKESRCGFHDYAENTLRELRDRIKAEGKACNREDRKHTVSNISSHFRDGIRNPREIAWEIARQIRESVTQDLLLDSDRSNNFHSTMLETKERNFPCRHSNDLNEIAVSSDSESSTPFRRLFWDLRSRSGSNVILPGKYVKNPDASETHGIKTRRKRVTGRSKPIPVDLTSEKQFPNLLESQQVSIHTKSLYSSVTDDKDNLNGFRSQQVYPCIDGLLETNAETNSGYDLDRLIDIPFRRRSEECMDNLCGMLPRSRSVSVPRMSESIELKRNTEDIPETYVEKTIVSSVNVNKTNANVAKTPGFISKTSGASGFTIEYQQADNKVHGASFNSGSDLLESTNNMFDAVDKFEFICRHAMPDRNSSVKNCHTSDGYFTVDKVQVWDDVAPCNFNKYKAATTALNYEDNKQQGIQTAAVREDCNDSLQHSTNNFPLRLETVYHLPNEASGNDLEVGKEKLEQPSPVSVLDSPFQEEVSSPVSFKGIRSDLHELRLQLHLLKRDNCERSQLDLQTMLNEHGSYMEERRTKESDNCSQTVSEAEPNCSHILTFDDLEHIDIGSIGLTEEAYSLVRSAEMLYLGTVLIASGFNGDSASISTNWYAPNQPLNPYLFQKINGSCYKHCTEIQEITEASNGENRCIAQVLLNIPDRRLLFDCLNEILVDILGIYPNFHPWVMPSNLRKISMPTGKELMKLVSMQASRLLYLHSVSQDSLENLVVQDLSRGDLWMDFIDDTKAIGMELEKAIFNDLIDDAVISVGNK